MMNLWLALSFVVIVLALPVQKSWRDQCTGSFNTKARRRFAGSVRRLLERRST